MAHDIRRRDGSVGLQVVDDISIRLSPSTRKPDNVFGNSLIAPGCNRRGARAAGLVVISRLMPEASIEPVAIGVVGPIASDGRRLGALEPAALAVLPRSELLRALWLGGLSGVVFSDLFLANFSQMKPPSEQSARASIGPRISAAQAITRLSRRVIMLPFPLRAICCLIRFDQASQSEDVRHWGGARVVQDFCLMHLGNMFGFGRGGSFGAQFSMLSRGGFAPFADALLLMQRHQRRVAGRAWPVVGGLKLVCKV